MSCHMLDIFWVGGWIHNICMGLLVSSHFLCALLLTIVVPRASPCFIHIRIWSLVTLLDLLMVFEFVIYFSLDIMIFYAMDKLLFYSPTELLILAFFCSYSYPFNPLLCIFTLMSLEFTKLEGFDCLIIFSLLCLNKSLPV